MVFDLWSCLIFVDGDDVDNVDDVKCDDNYYVVDTFGDF